MHGPAVIAGDSARSYLYQRVTASDPGQRMPPAGPAFLSPQWLNQFRESVQQAKQLGLQVDFSVVSSWDLGGHWIQPHHGSMGLYSTETAFEGGRAIDLELPFPPVPPAAPVGGDARGGARRGSIMGGCG